MSKEIEVALQLDKLPNVPYLTSYITKEIKLLIENIPNFEFREDHLAIYAHYHKGNPPNALIIDTHLDHPGFIVKKDTAIPVGSIALPEMISDINKNQKEIPVDYHSPEGEKIGEGILKEFVYKNNRVTAKAINYSSEPLPINSQAIPKVETGKDGQNIRMRSADNLSVTAVAIELMSWLSTSSLDAEVTFIFTKLEEVRQISATGIALRKETPFAKFSDRTHIIALEAALAENRSDTANLSPKKLDYDSGTIIRISDHKIVYQVDKKPNFAEALALHARDKGNIPTQHGAGTEQCDAISYTLFSGCPNIIGLTVPCKNKHNFDNHGRLSPEVIKENDLINLSKLLRRMIKLANEPIEPHSHQIITPQKGTSYNTLRQLSKKKRELQGAYEWAKPRIESQHLLPESTLEQIQFIFGAIKSRIIR